MPWEWEELCGRCTVGEIERVIAGALWREARAMDALAWQTAHLMNATGNYKEPVRMETLLGRDPLPPDPRAAPREADGPVSEKAERAMGLLHAAELQKAGGGELPTVPAPKTHT